jgi:antitoxin component YwqK of YwqJK toxin-antitoxin module
MENGKNEVIEYHPTGEVRSITIYENGKKISKKRYRTSGKFIDEWKRSEDWNCIIFDEAEKLRAENM